MSEQAKAGNYLFKIFSKIETDFLNGEVYVTRPDGKIDNFNYNK